MNLDTKPHPRRYRLQWLSEGEEVKVTQQIEVFHLGRYNDRVLCDVIPMEATHILLGRLWQYDTKAVHDGFTNKISFQHHDQKIILKPLSPREMCDDQIRMGKKREQEKEKSEAPKRNRKKKSDTHEIKFNCLAKASEVRIVLHAR